MPSVPPPVTLFSNSDQIPSGTAVRVDGWPGRLRERYTISIHMQAFIGQVVIEGALATAPQEGDWFPLYEASGSLVSNGEKTIGTTLVGRYTWMRVRITSPLGIPTGTIDRVLLR
jgi:hypothetical protein